MNYRQIPLAVGMTLGVAVTLAITLPLKAQVESDTEIFDTSDQETTVDDAIAPSTGDAIDEDVGIPEASDDSPTTESPEATESPETTEAPGTIETTETATPTPDDVIILEVDGERTLYSPVDVDESTVDDANIPVFILNVDDTSEATTPTDVGDAETTPAEAAPAPQDSAGMDDERETFVIYPPADSLDELDAEDIVE